jgi:hypothetical protein
MKFTVLEKSFIEHAMFEEGATWSPKESLRDADGNPVMRISDNLAPADDEATAFKAEADTFFDKVEAERKAAENAAQGKTDTSEFNADLLARLGALASAFESMQVKLAGKATAAKADAPAAEAIA